MRRLALAVLGLGAGCAASAKATVGAGGGGTPAQRQVSQKEKSDFARVVAAWRDLSRDGSVSAEACKRIADQFGDVADDHPKIVEARYNQGAVLERCGDPKAAREAYDRALGAVPNYSQALAGVGRLLLKGGDEGRAFEYFDRAIKSDPKNDQAYLGMAQVQHERAKRGDAQAAKDARNNLRRALAIDAYNMDTYATLALLEYDLAGNDAEKLDMARLVAEQSKKIHADYAPVHNIAGLISLKRNNVTAALASFKKAAELDAGLLAAHMNIAAITLNFRDYATAEQSFRHVLKSQPQNFDALIGLGVALRGLRNAKEAEKLYNDAAKANPDDPAPLYNLGVLYQDYLEQTNDQLNKAKDYYNQFISRSQDKARIEDAKNRIKNIDDTFRALEEAKKMQAEMEKMQKEMEEAQRKMEEAQKLQEQQQPQPPEGAAPAPK